MLVAAAGVISHHTYTKYVSKNKHISRVHNVRCFPMKKVIIVIIIIITGDT